jgi:hypothetical protein
VERDERKESLTVDLVNQSVQQVERTLSLTDVRHRGRLSDIGQMVVVRIMASLLEALKDARQLHNVMVLLKVRDYRLNHLLPCARLSAHPLADLDDTSVIDRPGEPVLIIGRAQRGDLSGHVQRHCVEDRVIRCRRRSSKPRQDRPTRS